MSIARARPQTSSPFYVPIFESRAFVSLEYDILLSFAGADDLALPGESGWVSGLRTTLDHFLLQILGDQPRIATTTDHTLGADAAHTVGLVVAILSPSFVRDTAARDAIEAFASAAGPAGGGRLVKVIKSPVPLEQVAASLGPAPGHDFFEIDATGATVEFRTEFGTEAKQQFFTRTYQLAQALAPTLLAMRGAFGETPAAPGVAQAPADAAAPLPQTAPPQPETAVASEPGSAPLPAPPASPEPAAPAATKPSGPAGPEPATGGKVTLFLAETIGALRDRRAEVRSELQQLGYVVLPEGDLPVMDSGRLVEAVNRGLEAADLSVHLIGHDYGLVPEGESRSVVELQLDAAGDRIASRLLWIAAGDPADERQSVFLDGVRNDAVGLMGTELYSGSFEEFKNGIRELAERAGKSMNGDQPAAEDRIEVYVVCDRTDYPSTKQLEDYLRSRGFAVVMPAFEGEEAIELHKNYLLYCDANLLFYGQAADTWVQMKLLDWRKLAGWGREKPMLAKGVYVAPPSDDRKRRFKLDDGSLVMRVGEGFKPEALDPFLERIASGKRRG